MAFIIPDKYTVIAGTKFPEDIYAAGNSTFIQP